MKGLETLLIDISKRWHHLPRGTMALMVIAEFVIVQRNDQFLIWVGGIAALSMLAWVLRQSPKEEAIKDEAEQE